MHFNPKLVLTFLVTVPSALAAVNGRCTGKNGICISTGTCSNYGGSYTSGYCPNDPNDVRCCDNIPCKSDNGTPGNCVFTNQCASGNMVSGKCPGGSDFKCCLGNTPTTTTTCSYQGLSGECKNVNSCDGNHFTVAGLCPGSAQIKCCLPKVTCDDGSGKCLTQSQCNSEGGSTVSNKCAKYGNDIKCCRPGSVGGNGNVLSKAQYASDYLRSYIYSQNPHPTQSTGYCARYVRIALEAAGFTIGTIPRGCDYYRYGTLSNLGFREIGIPSTFNKGDIIVIDCENDTCGKNNNGKCETNHIEMYNGSEWLSDFNQSGAWYTYGKLYRNEVQGGKDRLMSRIHYYRA